MQGTESLEVFLLACSSWNFHTVWRTAAAFEWRRTVEMDIWFSLNSSEIHHSLAGTRNERTKLPEELHPFSTHRALCSNIKQAERVPVSRATASAFISEESGRRDGFQTDMKESSSESDLLIFPIATSSSRTRFPPGDQLYIPRLIFHPVTNKIVLQPSTPEGGAGASGAQCYSVKHDLIQQLFFTCRFRVYGATGIK